MSDRPGESPRVEAAARALNELVDASVFRRAAEGKPDAEEAIAETALAAADEAEPMVPRAELEATERFADSSEHPNWQAGWDAGYARGQQATQGNPRVICHETGMRSLGGICPEHNGDACLISLPGFYERAQEDREARFRAERAARELAEALRRWLSETAPGQRTNTAKGRSMACRALEAHPEYDPARTVTEATSQGRPQGPTPESPDRTALEAAVEAVSAPYSDFRQVATRAIEAYVRERQPVPVTDEMVE